MGLVRFDDGLAIDGSVTKAGNSTLYVAPGGFSMSAGSVLDLAGGWIDVGYAGNSPIDSIRALVASAYDHGVWDGPGIRLDPAAQLLEPGAPLGIAVVDAKDVTLSGDFPDSPYVYPGVMFGASVVGTSQSMPMVLIRAAILGDTDMNGYTDYYDLANFVAGLNGQLSGWVGGDFNYDGVTDIPNDFAMFMKGYLATGGPDDAEHDDLIFGIETNENLTAGQKAEMLALVPEPNVAMVGCCVVVMMLHKRRRKGYERGDDFSRRVQPGGWAV